ncbi:hypothetical protein BGZ89_004542 [Linnemannia elongata]|nr:hypothetical protein BGZ89_004542 [Linnemannia elongata]
MAPLTEAYICHVGNVLDFLLQDKDLDTESHSFPSPNPLPLEFVDASTPQYIHNVDANLQSLVQKMFKMEQELAWHRRHFKAMHPATTITPDITLAPPILTPPVDSLSTPPSASSRWNEGHWEFINHPATHTSTLTNRTLPGSPLPPSIDTLVPELVSGTITPPTHGASLAASHSSNASEKVAVCLNGHIPEQRQQHQQQPQQQPPPTEVMPCTQCIHNCAQVAAAVVRGDLGVRIHCTNIICQQSNLFKSVNEMVAKLSNFTAEVIQVAAQGVEGRLGVQAKMEDERGIWREFVNHLNTMTVGHSEQVRDIASVCTAVAHGDLSQKITVVVKGETLVLKNTINTMVDQLRSFSSEVTRVAHEVGTEGKLGGQAHVKGVDGTWKELTDNVNTMAENLTAQVRDIASVSKAVARGDLSKKISVEVKGEMMDLKNTINTMVDQLQEFATEVSRVSLEVGTEGKLGGQAHVKDVSGTWKELTDNVNLMAENLTAQVRDIADVCKAVACGDLTKKVSVPVQGEILELKETMNTMVDQLRTFAAEVTRVAREVGTEGKLGGQAEVEGVDGTWKELTDNVNTMAANLTAQVRDIASVSKAVAKGDLSKKISVEVKGEMMDLKRTFNIMVDQLQEFATEVSRVSLEVGTEGKLGGQAVVKGGEISEVKLTVNSMVEQLRTFAAEVTRVAREVGTEGKLGGQAHVKGVDGTWKELTDNVNTMAANLTAQVRDIASVSKAVAKGDLSKKR